VSKAVMVAKLITLVETQRIAMHPAMPFAEAMLEEMRQYVREPTHGSKRRRHVVGRKVAVRGRVWESVW
jgi:hypothetical protein